MLSLAIEHKKIKRFNHAIDAVFKYNTEQLIDEIKEVLE